MPSSPGAFLLSMLSTAFLISVRVKFLSSGVFTVLCDSSLICLLSSVSSCMESSGVKCSSVSFVVSSMLDVSVPSCFWSVVRCVCLFLLTAANL